MTVRRVAPFAPFVLLAYLPALLSSPGRMPADSKLYLYLDPGGFFADAAASFDPSQFAGWVPHQHIAHLWPSLPWFWSFELLGLPDWVAHRLWIGTLFLAAGLGVRWSARLLGIGACGAVVAGLVYQLSPYVLPYVSRTSVMLLPWAGLGWILAFTVRAVSRRTWSDPAAIALVVLTVGAVNATALLLIVPVPAVWLVHIVRQGMVPLRAATVVAMRTGLLCTGVSAWWVAALVIQGRYGADVLPYSEALADVSAASTSAEVWRGLGYWLFYVRDGYAPTTSAASPYLTSSFAIAVSVAVPVVCLIGLVWVRWMHRSFAATLVVVGGVLAVGVHPIDDRSPLIGLLTGGSDEGLVLALRSSTRALPVMILGLALAGGALVASIRQPVTRRVTAWSVTALAVVNVPALWSGSLVDPAIDRDQDPPSSWIEAAGSLSDSPGRVLVLPGAEFGAYRWGYTVDQPLPGLTDMPVVTRDLLPLGSPAAMDLVFALDDRIQDGVIEPGSIAPVARLLGVGTVWLTNDAAFDRFRTARPEVVRDVVASADGLGEAVGYGEPTINRPDVPMVDERSLVDDRLGRAMAPVELVPVERGSSSGEATIDRVAAPMVLLAGSGDGIVDAAAVGLVRPGVAIGYTADTSVDGTIPGTVVGAIVTDSNRDRARHWRGSQDTTGYTEPGGPDNGLLREGRGDARLPIFSNDDPTSRTTAVQVGPVMATATSYGEPFAFTPEHRPVMAIDGDPSTAWLVGEHVDPVGESIRLSISDARPVDELRLVQAPESGRWITLVEVVASHATSEWSERQRVELDERSRSSSGQVVSFGRRDIDRIDITVLDVEGSRPSAVGFSEIDVGRSPTIEVVRPPSPGVSGIGSLPSAYVFSRLRVDPLDRWRSDPEPSLVRSWTDETDRTVRPTFTVRVDPRTTDAELARLFGWPVVADRRLTGSLRSVGVSAFDGDIATAWTGPFDDPSGRLTVTGVDAVVDSITVVQPSVGYSTITEIVLESAGETRRLELAPDESGSATITVDPPLDAEDLSIAVSAVDVATTIDRRFGDVVPLPVSISEIDFDGAPQVSEPFDVAMVVECATLGQLDGQPLRATVTLGGAGWLDGDPLPAASCDDHFVLPGGTHLLEGAAGALVLDRVVLDDRLIDTLDSLERAPPSERLDIVDRGRFGGRYRIACPDGCWFVFGEGFNDGWDAKVDGRRVGAPALVDGGFNGWWIEPEATEVVVTWRPQRYLTAAMVVSGLSVLGALALVVVGRRRRPPEGVEAGDGVVQDQALMAGERLAFAGPGWVIVLAWCVPAALIAGPGWGLFAALGGLVALRYRTVPLASLGAAATVATVGLAMVVVEARNAPAHDLGWPSAFAALHGFGMLALALVLTSVLVESDRLPEPSSVSRAEAGGTPDAARAAAS